MDSQNAAGICIIRTQKHLQEFVGQVLTQYDSIVHAGKAGRLMCRIRNMEVVHFNKLKVLSDDVGIGSTELKKIIIPTLEQAGVVDTFKDPSGSILKIEENIPSLDDIFPIVNQIYASFDPGEQENATLTSQELVSEVPYYKTSLMDKLRDLGFSERCIHLCISSQSSCDILGEIPTENGPLLYSEYVWGGTLMNKAGMWMSKLSQEKFHEVKSIISNVNRFQGIPQEYMNIYDLEMFNSAVKSGLIRTCSAGAYEHEKDFVFTPSVGEIFNDDSDEVKALLSCFRYGQYFSSISRIKDPLWVVDALLDRSEHSIGPASAIGRDYRVLEKMGIVKLKESDVHPGRFDMILLKQDVARRAREILKHGTVSGLEELVDPLMSPSDFISAEQTRIHLGKLSRGGEKAQEDIFKILRREDP